MKKAVGEFEMDGPRPGFMRVMAVRWDWTLVLGLLLALPCGGQNASSSGPLATRQMQMEAGDPDESLARDQRDPVFEARRLRKLSVAQHKAMVDDADRLLKLVTELNAEISSTNPSVLTPEELRKVGEIEKLARSVKDKMRTSLRAAPAFPDSALTPPFSNR